jgi:hypothetical protein
MDKLKKVMDDHTDKETEKVCGGRRVKARLKAEYYKDLKNTCMILNNEVLTD